jgi:hypothetical protein
MATPYVISSDLVSAYPAKSLEIAQYIDGFKADLALVQNAQTGTTYSFVAADFTKLVTLSNASPVAVTLPLEATVPWPAGTTLRLLNQGAGTVTVAGEVGVTINGTPLTLAQYKGAALIKTGTDTWTFAPFSSGVGAADFSNAATGSYSGYKYLTFTASGTITITTAGFADVLVIGGGGGGGAVGGGGGAGGYLELTDVYFASGSYTVTVGAGGAGSTGRSTRALSGNISQLRIIYAIGGGGGGSDNSGSFNASIVPGGNGGSGGGGCYPSNSAGGSGASGQGNNGGDGLAASSTQGGGGGAGGVGSTGTAVGGNGGIGLASSLTGTSVSRGGGGGGGTNGGTAGTATSGGGDGTNNDTTGVAGTANTGGGGGGGGFSSTGGSGGNGGSGIVIVRVAV